MYHRVQYRVWAVRLVLCTLVPRPLGLSTRVNIMVVYLITLVAELIVYLITLVAELAACFKVCLNMVPTFYSVYIVFSCN